MKNHGFTLIELMISIGIIGILVAASVFSYGNIRDRAQGNKVAADFQQIKLGWEIWKSSSNAVYPREVGGDNPDVPCYPEPAMDQTVVQPFLGDIHRDPWNIRYDYDNDGDSFTGAGSLERGVNVALHWCPGNGARYLKLAPFIDSTLDGGDGNTTGKVRWFTNPNISGGIYFLIAVNENS